MKHSVSFENRRRSLRRPKTLRSVARLVMACLLTITFATSTTKVGRAYYPEDTHKDLIDKASEGYQLADWKVIYGDDPETAETHLNNPAGFNVAELIKAGAIAEDHLDVVYFIDNFCRFNSHFWDPDNGGPWAVSDSVPILNCTGDGIKNSLHKAIALTAMALKSYRQGAYVDSYTKLGHLAHLLQDQSVPAHAHGHNHFEKDLGIYNIDWYDYYEYDMKTLDNSFTWDGSDSFWDFPSTPGGLIKIPPDVCQVFSDDTEWQQMWEKDEWKVRLALPSPSDEDPPCPDCAAIWNEDPPCPDCVAMQYDDDDKVIDPCSNTYGVGLAKIAYLMYTTNQYADWWASFNNGRGFSYGDRDVPDIFGSWIDYSELEKLDWDNRTLWPSKVQGHYNYRYAMRATATLFQVFEEMTKPTLYETYIRYVKEGSSGNCTSWEEACDLQAALAGPETNYEIWVAAGEYYPGDPGNRQAAFNLKNGVAMYGGFTGVETSRAQRDWETNITILSGDIGLAGDDGDNSYHVVSAVGLTQTATLDGFTIIGGNANAPTFPEQWGGGLYAENSNLAIRHVSFEGNSASGGGGMFINGGEQPVVLENVEFNSNTATVNGGGLHTYNGSNPTLMNVTLSGNSAASYGGGMYNFENSDPSLANVIFSGNSAEYGGGMFNFDNSDPTLVNVAFSGNSADVGGGMYTRFYGSPTLTNVTFSGNTAVYHGGGMDNQGFNMPVLTNCILWGNSAPNGAQIYNGPDSSATITNSDIQGDWSSTDDIQGDWSGTGNINLDPKFVDADGIDNIVGTLDDNLRLQFTSPAIDAGDNTALPAGVTTDLDGSLRIINDIIDMGAYEMTRPPIYVDQADLAIGVPGFGNEHGEVNVLYGTASGLSSSVNQPWHQNIGNIIDVPDSNDLFGSALAASDFDGDGYSDLAIGVPGEDLNFLGDEHGAVNVLYSTASGLSDTGNQFWTQDWPDVKEEADSNDRFGSALTSGDFNGDGYSDLAIGVPGEDLNFLGDEHGAVNVLYGSAFGLFTTGNQLWTQDSPGVVNEEAESNDRFGSALTSGDFNGDGYSDLAIGVPGEDIKFLGSEHGAVNVLYGTAEGLSSTGNQFWTQDTFNVKEVAESGDRFGSALTTGDFNGDGYYDLAIGVPGESGDMGVVNLLYGSAVGLTANGNQLWSQNEPEVEEVMEENDQFGFAMASGDLNGDGYFDLAIGVPGESGDMGAVNLLYGSAVGLTANGDQLLSQDEPGVEDVMEENDQFGFALASGDLNGDGIDDLAVGVPYKNIDLTEDAGAIHVFYGSLTGLTTEGKHLLHQGNLPVGNLGPSDYFGYALAIGTFNAALPEALADAYSTDEDIPLSVDPPGVLTNDTDVDGDPLTAVLDTDVSNGTLTLNLDGSFTYTPTANFNGTDSFRYHAWDGQANSNITTVTITVIAVNDAPVVENTSNSGPIQEGGSATITVSAYDVDNLNNYNVENQWGGSTSPWNPGGTWVIGNHSDQRVIALNVTSNDGGENLIGTMIYAGEGPIAFRATRTAQNTYEVENQWGGSATTWNPGGTWILGDRSGQNVVAIDISSNDGGATLTGAMTYAGEGPISFRAVVNDPLTYSFDCDGDSSYEIGPQSSNSISCSYGDDGDFTVNVLVEDDDGGSAISSTVVSVNNVAPTVTLLGLNSVDEGQTKTYSYTVSDPGSDTFTLDSESCGTAGTLSNSSFNSGTGAGSFDCTFPDGPATSIVSVTVSDDDGGSGSTSREVTVQNVAPSVSPAEDQTIPLGYTDALQLGSFIDPGSQDAPWAIEVDWGDGSIPESGSTSTIGPLNPLAHSFSSAGWYTVEVSVTDKDGEPASAQFQITVENPEPKISALTPLSVQAGGVSDLSLTINGSEFVSTSLVRWDGEPMSTTFLSNDQLQAAIPAGLIATAKTAEITVYNPAPGGGISTPMAFFVTENEVTVQDYGAATSTDTGGSATASTENTSVEAIDGTGTVVVAEYSGNPSGANLFNSSGAYLDVYLSADSSFEMVKITINNVEKGSKLAWWDGEEWVKIVVATYDPHTYSITFVVTAETTPSIDQLSGTEFGLVDGGPYAVSANPDNQAVQYSDEIVPVTIEARDAGDGEMTASIDLSWLNISEASCSPDGGNTICTWMVTGTAGVPAGSYEANVSIFDAVENQVEIPFSIEVLPENAAITFHAGNPVALKVGEDGGDSGYFELEVRVRETYPDNVPDKTNAYPGDIGLGQVAMRLVPVGPGGEVNGDCSVIGVFDEGYDAFQRVVCSFEAVPVSTYLATVTVDGDYYTGRGEDVLVVYDPSLGYTTGGGWFYWPGTEERTSFGFTMQYNNSGSNVKGSMLLIRHLEDGSIYQVKSNALYGLSLGADVENGATFGFASFSGKATYLEPGLLEGIGNHKFLIYVEDRNEPGSGVDQFWIEVYDKIDNLIALISMERPAYENKAPLQEGNIFVPH